MKIGYARVSTKDQNLDMQIDALKKEGCERVYTEKMSGGKRERPELEKLLAHLRGGDVLVIWKFDRLARSLKHLLELVELLKKKRVSILSIQDAVNTTTSQGRFFLNIMASLAEFEREINRERTKAGLAAARARGRLGGRPKGLSEEAQKNAIVAASLYKAGQFSINEICQKVRVSKATLYRYLKHEDVSITPYKKR